MTIVAKKRVCRAVVALGSATGLLAVSGSSVALFAAKAHAQAASAAQAVPTVNVGGITLRSAAVDLPTGEQMFPGGTSTQAINNNCLGCHSPDMVLSQPVLSPSTWREEIGKMRTAYKASVQEEDVPAIVAYLGSLRANE